MTPKKTVFCVVSDVCLENKYVDTYCISVGMPTGLGGSTFWREIDGYGAHEREEVSCFNSDFELYYSVEKERERDLENALNSV